VSSLTVVRPQDRMSLYVEEPSSAVHYRWLPFQLPLRAWEKRRDTRKEQSKCLPNLQARILLLSAESTPLPCHDILKPAITKPAFGADTVYLEERPSRFSLPMVPVFVTNVLFTN